MRAVCRHRRSTCIVALTVLALLLAACGTDDADAIPPETPADAPSDEADARVDDGDDQAADEPEPVPDTDTDEPAADPDVRTAPDPQDPDCSAHGRSVTVLPAGDVPDAVVAQRDLLIDAALRCDEQLLNTAIEESELFTFSYGDDRDPIGYWWDLEAAGEAPFLRLAQVLATTPAIDDDGELVVFPRVATGRAQDTTEEAWAELSWVEDLDEVAGTGEGYLGWRAGIAFDGQWRFFVVGD